MKAQTEGTQIRRLNSANYKRGLTLLLDSKSDDYFVTADDFVGFKVLVHRPEAYPEVEGNAIAVGAGREFFVSVSASHTEGSKGPCTYDACLNFRHLDPPPHRLVQNHATSFPSEIAPSPSLQSSYVHAPQGHTGLPLRGPELPLQRGAEFPQLGGAILK